MYLWHGASTDPRRWHPPNFVEFQTMCSQLPAVEIAWDLKQHVPHTLESQAYQGGRTVVKTPRKLLICQTKTLPKFKQRFGVGKKRANSNLQSPQSPVTLKSSPCQDQDTSANMHAKLKAHQPFGKQTSNNAPQAMSGP